MSDLDKESLDAIERRLIARAGLAPPAGHRDQVLAVVRDTLAENRGPLERAGAGVDVGSRAALVAMALSAALVIVAPWAAVARTAAPVPAETRLVAQARAAGIDLPVAAVATTSGQPLGAPSPAALPDLLELRHDAWRLRTLLQGEL
jgi:hypothetical protein